MCGVFAKIRSVLVSCTDCFMYGYDFEPEGGLSLCSAGWHIGGSFMAYRHTLGGETYSFETLKDLLAAASPVRSGDQLAGPCAT